MAADCQCHDCNDLTLPTGPQGEKGDTGNTGAAGSGSTIVLANTSGGAETASGASAFADIWAANLGTSTLDTLDDVITFEVDITLDDVVSQGYFKIILTEGANTTTLYDSEAEGWWLNGIVNAVKLTGRVTNTSANTVALHLNMEFGYDTLASWDVIEYDGWNSLALKTGLTGATLANDLTLRFQGKYVTGTPVFTVHSGIITNIKKTV